MTGVQDAAAWLGIDLGGTKTAALVLDGRERVRARGVVPSLRDEGPAAVLARTAELARDVLGEARAAGLDVRAAGVGFAGLVDAAAGVVTSSVILPGWDQRPLGAELATTLELPVHVDNDANCAGLSDWAGRGAPAHGTHVLFTVGTGIGGAIVHEGRLVRGQGGVSGEFGHMPVDLDGEPCWCDGRGCLHTLASGSAIAERAWRAARAAADDGSPLALLEAAPPLQEVAAAAAAGDAHALRAIEDGARALGAGITTVVQVLNPATVSLAGGVLGLGEDYLARVRAEVEARTFAESRAGLTLEPSPLGPDAGAVGAALLARQEHAR